jgi:hypothetical protein
MSRDCSVRPSRTRGGRELASQGHQQAAEQHGTLRYHQGYSVPLLMAEARLLQDVISACVRRNFSVIDLSNLVSHLIKMSDTVSMELKNSVRAFTNQQGWRSFADSRDQTRSPCRPLQAGSSPESKKTDSLRAQDLTKHSIVFQSACGRQAVSLDCSKETFSQAGAILSI